MGISFWHLVILLVVVLLFFGPQRLPGLGKSVGEAIKGFKKGLEDTEIDVTGSQEQLHKGEGQQAQAQNQTEKDKSSS